MCDSSHQLKISGFPRTKTMKTIVITEKQAGLIQKEILKESLIGDLSQKVLIIKNYLDKNFVRADYTDMESGEPQNKGIVGWLNGEKEVVKTLTDVQLFYFLQEKYKNILPDKEDRDKFLKQVIKDWYNHKISKNGTLSVYSW